MTKPTSNPIPSADANPFGLPLGMFTVGNGHGMDAWMQMNRAVLEGIGKLQQETGRFVVRRLEEDLARQQQILACRTPQDAWQICADFTRQAVQDYSDEAGRLSEIAAEAQYACSGFGEILAGTAVEATTPVETADSLLEPRKSAA